MDTGHSHHSIVEVHATIVVGKTDLVVILVRQIARTVPRLVLSGPESLCKAMIW